MEPNPYESPQQMGYERPRQADSWDSWLKDKLLLLLIGTAIIVFGFGPIYLFFYFLIGP